MGKGLPGAASVRRPQRQRTPTTLYTDDNPSTFTIKVKKTKAQREAEARAAPDSEAPSTPVPAPKRPRPSSSPSLAPTNGRRHSTSPYFRRDGPDSRRVTDTSDDLVSLSSRVSNASRRSSGNASTGSHGRKRKLPAHRNASPVPAPAPPASVRHMFSPSSAPKVATATTCEVDAAPSTARQDNSRSSRTSLDTAGLDARSPLITGVASRADESMNMSPGASPPPTKRQAPNVNVDPSLGSAVSHSVRIRRALPPFQSDVDKANKSEKLLQQQRNNMIHGDGLGVPAPLPLADWTPLYSPDVYFDKDYVEPTNDHDDDDSSHHMPQESIASHPDSPRGPQSPLHESPSKHRKRRRKELHPNLLPVTRTVTCMATRKPNLDYLAVGDSAGFVLIYSLGAKIRPVARLESAACHQRSYEQQERARQQRGKYSHTRVVNTGTGPDDAISNASGSSNASTNANGASGNIVLKKKPMRRLVIDTAETTIHSLGLVGTRVVLATSCELECMDIPSQTSLWVCPLMRDRLVTSLDIHTISYDILVSCSLLGPSVKEDGVSEAPAATSEHPSMNMTSPLMLLTYSHNNVEICDANSPILVKSPCCTAIWDMSKTVENRLLFIAPDDQELELVLVQGGSIDNWKVACKTRIPIKTTSVPTTRLSQSEEGVFTLVASSRGIRLYQTETLQLVHTYGDQLALHGKSIVWQDCLLVGRNRYRMPQSDDEHGPVQKTPQGNMYLYEDLLCVNVESSEKCAGGSNGASDSASVKNRFEDLGQFIIGVPHPTKGPEELCEALHVWRVEQATVVPALSIPLPKWSNGVQSLVVSRNTNLDQDRFILATQSGECHMLLPKLVSSFAGHMYPVGSHLVRDNIEYIEDEDELDVNATAGLGSASPSRSHRLPSGIKPEDLSDDLREAVLQSLLEEEDRERREKKETTYVNIVDSDDSYDPFSNIVIPCRPEPYLQQDVDRDSDDLLRRGRKARKSDSSLGADNFSKDVLGLMPQSKRVRKYRKFRVQSREARVKDEQEKKPMESAPSSNTFFKSNRMTIATITAVPPPINPCVVVAKGRSGKRSRSANLEAMLRASIDPQLERFMTERRQSWSNGSGSKLPPESELHAPTLGSPSSIKPTSEAKVSLSTNGATKPSDGMVATSIATTSQGATVSGSTGSTVRIDCETRSVVTTRIDGRPVSGPSVGKSGSPLPICTQQDSVLLNGVQMPPITGTPIASTSSAVKADETDVALGLLGLSPEKPSMRLPDGNRSTAGQASLSILSAKKSLETSPSKIETSGSGACPKVSTATKDGPMIFCSACLGRHVIHTCGKRELPVDVEEILRVEREKREAEEEEKKKLKAEKRRQADAKRRETRRKKQQEKEERSRREQEKATPEVDRVEHVSISQHTMQSPTGMEPPPSRVGGYMQSNRFGVTYESSLAVDGLPASYFGQSRPTNPFDTSLSPSPPPTYVAPAHSSYSLMPTGWPETCAPPDPSPLASTPHAYSENGFRGSSETSSASDTEEQMNRFSPSRFGAQATEPAPTQRILTMGLSSAEGLAALASIAESTSNGFSFSYGSRFASPQPISFDEATNSHLEEKKSTTSLHGFGSSTRDEETAGTKRAIPSYESIHSSSYR